MVRRSPRLRQAEGDVHRLVEIQQLERDQSLVVVHRQHRIEFPLRRIAENRIRHIRAGEGGEAGFVERGDGGGDDGFFLAAESAVLPGMGVQPADGDAGGCDAPFPEKIRRQAADAENPLRRQQARDIGEAAVDRREANGQGRSRQEHPEIRAAERIGVEFRLAGKRETDGLQAFLGNRAGDHGGGIRLAEQADAFLQRIKRRLRGFAGRLSGDAREPVPDHAEIEALRQPPRSKGGIHDFRPDPGGIAEGDEDFRHGIEMNVERCGGKLEASPRC